MKPLTGEWVQKAEGDFQTAQRELSVPDSPNPDAVCFHAQQCVEKYLKARLVEADIEFPKTHDLATILDLVVPVEPEWERVRASLNTLTDRAVEVRYPGYLSSGDEAEESLRIAAQVRGMVREAMGLD